MKGFTAAPGPMFGGREVGLLGVPDRRDDVHVRAAPAQVAAHPIPDLGVRQVRLALNVRRDVTRHAPADLPQHPHRGTDLPRRAVPALETVVIEERLLQRVKVPGRAQALCRHDLRAVIRGRQSQAGQNALTVDQDGTRPRIVHDRSLS
ncbi:hypothetical protein GCM10010842_33580 [Deinococcus daejeonensis]|uniref:Uncharacterized protein n=1 Tax=Deinococcus daejeonensis TaxID=1007098 RepID=A0ABQ2JDA9_9DEIO|nr:hypothetical protein GCM10010842_33580 [Deinococcus daejeonensis]